MRRGLVIDGVHTGLEWDLILTAQSIGLPEPKTNYVDVPERDGELDLTEALTGEVHYGNREGTFTFDYLAPHQKWANTIEKITMFCHGKKHTIILPDDPNHFYVGRIEVSSFKTSTTVAHFEFKTICEPYRYDVNPTIYDLTIPASGVLLVDCLNARKHVLPSFTANGSIVIAFKNNSYSMSVGTFQFTNLIFIEGKNPIKITGASGAKIQIQYQKGAI